MIILLILKIIGIVLLVVLGVLVLFIGMVLFDPICYHMKGQQQQEHTNAQIQVNWLFHIVGVTFEYSDEVADACLRILFFKKSFLKDTNKIQNQTEETDNEQPEPERALDAVMYIDSEYRTDETDGKADFEEKARVEKTDAPKKRFVWTKIQKKKDKLVSKIKEIGKIKDRTICFLKHPGNQRALHHIKKEAVYLLKSILPKRMRLELKFSMGDPAYTGIILGIAAMFPMGYKNNWNIQPDFEAEQAYAEGSFDVRGFVFIYQILFHVIRIIVDKDCRRMYNKYKKSGGQRYVRE